MKKLIKYIVIASLFSTPVFAKSIDTNEWQKIDSVSSTWIDDGVTYECISKNTIGKNGEIIKPSCKQRQIRMVNNREKNIKNGEVRDADYPFYEYRVIDTNSQ